MSYTGMGAIKATVGPCPGGGSATCTGGERAAGCNEVCCPTNLWSNFTYRGVKGMTTWRHENELRVAYAFAMLLSGAAAFGAAHGASVSPQLLSEISLASAAFAKAAPAGRWTLNPNGVMTACMTSNYYSRWTEGSPKLTAAQQNLINMVPGSEDSRPYNTRPTIDELLTVKNGAVVGSPWLDAMIAMFAPGARTISSIIVGALNKQSTTNSIIGKVRMPVTVTQDGAVVAGGGMATGTKVALGLGVVALAGLGAMWLKRRG